MATVLVCCPHCQTTCPVEDPPGAEALCPSCGRAFVPAAAGGSSGSRSSPWPWLSDAPPGATLATTPGRGEAGRPADEVVAQTWQPGDVILGLYEVREVFTGGGRGLVYRVWHRGWEMDLAVKCPRPEFFRNEEDKQDFEQEAETWVKLGLHPHLAACHYVRRLGGIPRVFAEFVAGGSLEEWVRSRRLYAGGRAAALERILDVAIQFAWGLQHAHEQGLVHRDVKPGNVLLTPEGGAKVTDFGMAKARGGPGGAPAAAGAASILVSAGGLTPAYCSPEQVLGQPVSRKTDVWSWGVSLLALFAGGASWSSGYLGAGLLQDYLARPPADPRLPPMPAPVVDLLRRCFQKAPESRPRDMLEVAAVLQRAYAQAAGHPYRREPPQAAKALADSLNNRALSLCDLHKLDEADRLWEEALAASPHHPECTYNLGLSRWRAGRLGGDTFLHRLREVSTSHPGQWLPPYLLAQVHLEQGDWQAAADVLAGVTGAAAEQDEVRAALAAARERLADAGRRLRSFAGHTSWVSSVCATPDGRFALSGSADGTLKLWATSSGRCLHTFTGHGEWVTSVSLGAGGRRALSGSADRTLKLWDTAGGECLRTFAGHANWVLAAVLSGDGRLALSAGGDGQLRLWDAESGECLRTVYGHDGPILAAALGADGRLALSAGRDRVLHLWEVAAGRSLRTLTGHADKVSAAALSADGRRALSGSADRTLKLWDTESGQCLRTFAGHQGGVTAVCFSAGGGFALSGSEDRTIKLWQLTTGRCLLTLSGHGGTVNSLALCGGRQLLSASADQTLALWAVPADRPAPFVLSRVSSSDAALAAWADYERSLARARQAAAAGDAVRAAGHVREARAQPGYGRRPEAMALWAALYARLPRSGLEGGWCGETFAGHAEAVTSVCLGGGGRFALSGSADRTLRLWETSTGRCLHTFEADTGGVTAVCLDGTGRYALSASTDGTLKLWEVTTGHCLRTCRADTDVLTSAGLSPDGRLAVAGSTDGLVQLWDLAAGRLLRVLRGHTDAVHSVCLSADGRHVLSGSAQFIVRNDGERLFTCGQMKLWETASGRCLPAFDGHVGAVTAVCLSPCGSLALTGGGQAVIRRDNGRFFQSGGVQLWELSSGRRLCSLEGHAGAVTSVCLGGGGRYAASGGTDRTLRLWDLEAGRCLRTFGGHADAVTSVALAGDGRYALSGSADRTLKLWVLDWELEDRPPADWDEAALPYLEMFLSRHRPYAAPPPIDRKRTVKEMVRLPLGRLFKSDLSEEEVVQALTRQGEPVWTEGDFQELLDTLGCAGFGWLRPEGVRRRLEELARG